ncbi:MAG: response regulator transcription factor [Flavobacterium sp.]|nr:MAG: response regulator transcription factor [Flavobacterium sp.]
MDLISKYKRVLLYGVSLAGLLTLMRLLELRFMVMDHQYEIYTGAIALLFTGLGIWLTLKLAKPKESTIIVETEVDHTRVLKNDERVIEKAEISRRELDVLQLMAKGHSNKEIADQLFVSVNTVKTHTSKLFEKLEVKRRMQAVEKARQMGIIE